MGKYACSVLVMQVVFCTRWEKSAVSILLWKDL